MSVKLTFTPSTESVERDTTLGHLRAGRQNSVTLVHSEHENGAIDAAQLALIIKEHPTATPFVDHRTWTHDGSGNYTGTVNLNVTELLDYLAREDSRPCLVEVYNHNSNVTLGIIYKQPIYNTTYRNGDVASEGDYTVSELMIAMFADMQYDINYRNGVGPVLKASDAGQIRLKTDNNDRIGREVVA